MKNDEKIIIKRFFECLLPITVCNLKCGYCYVIQRNYRNMKPANLLYSPEHIGKCLTKDRLGGACYFSICGAGETMAQKEIIDIIRELLKNGHIVNITTNGTLTRQFEKLKEIDSNLLKHLHFSFSFHYNELKRLKLLDIFFDNINLVKKIGCSFMVQLNLCDEYLDSIDDIKKICMKKVGAYPQIAATRKEDSNLENIELLTEHTVEEYKKVGNSFNSELFKYTMKNFNVRRKEFCYAGERSGVLNLATGELRKCYGDPNKQNIFANPSKKIKFEAVGNNCYSRYCLNSSHFMSLGVIDGIDEDITYVSLRNRENAEWFNKEVKEALDVKLGSNNEIYSNLKKIRINIKEKFKKLLILTKRIIKKALRIRKKTCQEPKN